MACSICNGHPGCPVCSPEPLECPSCKGEGKFYKVSFDGGDNWQSVSESVYDSFIEDGEICKDIEVCSVCEGDRVVAHDYYEEFQYD